MVRLIPCGYFFICHQLLHLLFVLKIYFARQEYIPLGCVYCPLKWPSLWWVYARCRCLPCQVVSTLRGGGVCTGGWLPGGCHACWVSSHSAFSCLGRCPCLPDMHASLDSIYHTPLWTEGMTHACKNITSPQLLLRTAKIQGKCKRIEICLIIYFIHLLGFGLHVA